MLDLYDKHFKAVRDKSASPSTCEHARNNFKKQEASAKSCRVSAEKEKIQKEPNANFGAKRYSRQNRISGNGLAFASDCCCDK